MADDNPAYVDRNRSLENTRNFFHLSCRNWLILVVVLTLLLAVFVVVAVSFVRISKSAESYPKPFTAFTGALDASFDPCHNFYDFVCNLWPKKWPSLQSYSTAFGMLQHEIDGKKAKILNEALESPDLPDAVNSAIKFYKLCVSRNFSRYDYKALTEYLDPIGGWPIPNESDWNSNSFDWLNATAFYSKKFDVHIVFRISLSVGHNGILISLKQPHIGKTYFETMMDAILMNVNCTNIGHVREVVYDAYRKWTILLHRSVDFKDEAILTIGDLIEQFSQIDWLRYFNLVYQDSLQMMNISFSLNNIVVIDDLNYLKRVDKALNSDYFQKFELANLFGTLLAEQIFVLIPGVLEVYAFDFDADEMQLLVEKFCGEIMDEILTPSVDYLYVKYAPFHEIEKSNFLAKYVVKAFRDLVSDSNWLDKDSKSSVLKTIDEMHKIIGFPPYLKNKTEFDSIHKNFPALSSNILESYICLREYLKHPDASKILPRSVTSVSAYYNGYENSLVFPIAMHNPPFFYNDGPSYLNFGAMGALIGHEIMHAFGSFDDSVKSVVNSDFETEAANAVFKNLTNCFVDQYDGFITNSTLSRSSIHTLRENVADSVGLRVSYLAHKLHEADFGQGPGVKEYNNYTSDQMFFISFATLWCSHIVPSFQNDPHNLPNARVNGAVSNSKYFAVAFHCPENSTMNPSEKCLIW